jgi:hypothetical protein
MMNAKCPVNEIISMFVLSSRMLISKGDEYAYPAEVFPKKDDAIAMQLSGVSAAAVKLSEPSF